MNLVSDLDLPAFDYAAPDFSADRFHAQREAGEFFLRSRKTAFPGRQIAAFFGVTSGPLAEHLDSNILNLGGESRASMGSTSSRSPGRVRTTAARTTAARTTGVRRTCHR
jgi:hypothetical protein